LTKSNFHILSSSPFRLYIRLLVLFLCLVPTISTSYAQSFQPSFRNYTVDDGLPSSEVHVAIQDNDGYMWFGTDNGLSRFDGYEFKNFGPEEGLNNPVIFDLKIGPEGKLWILTMSGNIYIYRDAKIVPYLYNDEILNYRSKYLLARNFRISSENKVSITLERLGILEISITGEIRLSYNKAAGLKIVSQKDLFAYFGTYLSNHEQNLKIQSDLIKNNKRHPINIYIKKDSFILNLNEVKATSFSALKLPLNHILIQYSDDVLLVHEGAVISKHQEIIQFNDIAIFQDTSFWIGLHLKKGIRVYQCLEDFLLGKFTTLLPDKSITKIYNDSDNGIWIMSLENGIYYCSYNYSGTVYESDNLKFKENIRSIDLSSEHLLILTRDNKIISLNINDNSTEQLINSNEKTIHDIYGFDMAYSDENNSIISGGPLTVTKNHKTNFYYDQVTGLQIGMRRIGSNSFQQQHLISTITDVLQLDLNSNAIIDKFTGKNFRIYCVNFDQYGNRWIGTEDGLFKWEQGSAVRITDTPNILHQRIESIEFLSNRNMVIGTKGHGIIIWDQKYIKYKITTGDGLSSNMIENIFIDSLDNIWVGETKSPKSEDRKITSG